MGITTLRLLVRPVRGDNLDALERALPGGAVDPSVGTRVMFGNWGYMHILTGYASG